MHVWIDHTIVSVEDARIHPFDRGFLFGDGVYETIQYFNRVGVGMDLHIKRLEKSLLDARISGVRADDIATIGRALLEKEQLDNAIFYAQITRGVHMPRRHRPDPSVRPTVFGYVTPTESLASFVAPRAIRAILLPDLRWRRCTIKGISLMANVLDQITCGERGADEAILLHDDLISEGTMTNVFVVINGVVRTPAVDDLPAILAGVTRNMVLDAAHHASIPVEIGPIRACELHAAEEIFVTSSRRLIDSVVILDDKSVGGGSPGPIASQLFCNVRNALANASDVVLR